MGPLIAGVEGGSTNSRAVILDSTGQLLGSFEGEQTNPWLTGLNTCAKRLIFILEAALANAGQNEQTCIDYLGLSLSGVDTEKTKAELLLLLRTMKPSIANHICIHNDSIGTFLTASDDAAIVLIAGTGSICNFIRKDLTFERVGGLGYMIGDGGSAYWIAMHLIKTVIEADERMIDVAYNLDVVRQTIYHHFGATNTLDLLEHFYKNFAKEKIARLCKLFSDIAHNGDTLAQLSFHAGGMELGRHVRGALHRAAKDVSSTNQPIMVICCGSVFKSWDLLSQGFCEALNPKGRNNWTGTLRLVRLNCTAAYGSARLANYCNTNLHLPLPTNPYLEFDTVHFELNIF